jgi:histidinol-phosphate aminotransferase
VLGNGSEALIAAISRAFLEAGQIVITVVPSFGLHEIEPLAMGAEVTKIPMQPDMEFDVEALVTALEAEPRLAFLSSPSNPVGTTLSEAGLRRLLGSVKPGTLFVLDEAYVEFRDGKYAYDSLSILEGSGVNFVSLRTFSKAYGLAGLRIGYGLASNARIAGLMRAALTPFNVNSAAQGAAVASLSDIEWLSETTAAIIATRNRLRLQLETLGLSAVRSEGNFLFIDTGCSATDVAARLLEAGVIVKPWKEKGFESYIRVSIGLPDEMDRFVAALSIILTEG